MTTGVMVTWFQIGRTLDPVQDHSSDGSQPAGGGSNTQAAAELP